MKAGEKIRPFQVSNELLGQWEKGNSQKKKMLLRLGTILRCNASCSMSHRTAYSNRDIPVSN